MNECRVELFFFSYSSRQAERVWIPTPAEYRTSFTEITNIDEANIKDWAAGYSLKSPQKH